MLVLLVYTNSSLLVPVDFYIPIIFSNFSTLIVPIILFVEAFFNYLKKKYVSKIDLLLFEQFVSDSKKIPTTTFSHSWWEESLKQNTNLKRDFDSKILANNYFFSFANQFIPICQFSFGCKRIFISAFWYIMMTFEIYSYLSPYICCFLNWSIFKALKRMQL